MSQIEDWLNQQLKKWNCDFVGLAVNVASSPEPKEIRWCYVAGNTNDYYKNIQLRLGKGIAGMVWRTGRMQKENHIFSQPEKLVEYPIARMEHLEATLGVPVIQDKQIVGVLLVGHRMPFDYTDEWVGQVETAALTLGRIIEGEKNDTAD